MIQPKTLKALNYFINEDITLNKSEMKNLDKDSRLCQFYKGRISALEETLDLINQDWKEENSI